ncbi:MAG TPA: hypothetical protein VGD21_06645 [Lysobacter sp.]
MIRKLVVPALLAGLLGGCVTAGYDYRYGRGDYYYGQPSTEYRYYGSPYGYYPYGDYRYSRYGYPYGYGGYYPYSYYNPYYGYPYQRPYYPRPPVVVKPPPPQPEPLRDGSKRDDYRVPPWRDMRRRPVAGNDALQPRPAAPLPPQRPVAPAPAPAPPRIEPRRDDGSRMQQMIRRSEEPRRRNVDSAQTNEQ